MAQLLLAFPIAISLVLCPADAGQKRVTGGAQAEQGGAAVVIAAVERGVREGDERLFAAYFSGTVSLNVPGSSAGYYSANQAGQVIRHFFAGRRTPAFSFTTIDTGDHPYATGSFVGQAGSSADRVQVYVGLARERSGWVISHFSVY